MTRFLSEALQAPEPNFRLSLRELEAKLGMPSHDIRYSLQIIQNTKTKIAELGLDPEDTTPEELYESLKYKLASDDRKLVTRLTETALSQVSLAADVNDGLMIELNRQFESKDYYALKNSRLKSVLKSLDPKKARRRLGYRSLDSMLRHESPAIILMAALVYESSSWHKQLISQYRKLTPSDFEFKKAQLIKLDGKRYTGLVNLALEQGKRNLFSLRELACLIVIPLPKEVPVGLTSLTLALGLDELSEFSNCSSYLRLKQLNPNFGEAVKQVLSEEPTIDAFIIDRAVPFSLIQHYYDKLASVLSKDLVEPYMALQAMITEPVEKLMTKIEPSFAFWQDTSALAILHRHKPLSLNLLDNSLNLTNKVSFEESISNFFKKSLWQNLILKYLPEQVVADAITSDYSPQLATELVGI